MSSILELSGKASERMIGGRNRWRQYYYDAAGKRKEVLADTRKHAIEKAEAKIEELRAANPAHAGDVVHPPSAKRTPTFSTFSEQFLRDSRAGRDGRMPLRPQTLDDYESQLRNWIHPILGDHMLHRITPSECKRLQRHLLDNAPSRTTAQRVLSLLKTILNYGVSCEHIASNPAQALRIETDWAAEDDASAKTPTHENMRKIDDAVRAAYHSPHQQTRQAYKRYYPAYLVLRTCGLRASELCGLKWTDLEEERLELTIQRGFSASSKGRSIEERTSRTKTKNSRRAIPIPTELMTKLREWRDECTNTPEGWMFPTRNGTPLNYHNLVARFWKPTLARAGVPHIGLHSLRHYYASVLLADGKIKEASKNLGHHSVAFTMDFYAHLIPDDAQQADGVRSAIAANMTF